jgi:colanic acid biosynthesis glycosyl transferase WcaI
MKVVFVNRFFYPDHSATSQMLTDIAFGLTKHGYDVHVITNRYGYEGQLLAHQNVEVINGVTVRRVASTQFGRRNVMGRILDYASFLRSVRSEIKRIATPGDIFVAKTDPPMLAAGIRGPIYSQGGRLVNWIQDLFPEVAEEAGLIARRGVTARLLRGIRDRALRDSTATVGVGERMCGVLRAKIGPSKHRTILIHNFADGTAIVPREVVRSDVREQFGLRDKFVVGYSGNFGRVHDIETILKTATLLRHQKAIRFLFIGGGQQVSKIKHAVSNEGLDNIVLAPYQPRERLTDSLSAADVHICSLSPQFEGLVVPSKVYGIMAAARPCIFIGDEDGEVAQIIKNGGFGMTVRPGDIGSLASAIEALARAPSRAIDLGQAGRSYFEKEFDLPVALRKWCDLLDEVCRVTC